MFGIQQDGTYRVENIGYSTPTLTDGYVVATRPIKREADLPTTGELFGRWTAEDGTVYWDAVEVVADLHAALTLAVERGELAVWDLAAGVEIPVTAAAHMGYAPQVTRTFIVTISAPGGDTGYPDTRLAIADALTEAAVNGTHTVEEVTAR